MKVGAQPPTKISLFPDPLSPSKQNLATDFISSHTDVS